MESIIKKIFTLILVSMLLTGFTIGTFAAPNLQNQVGTIQTNLKETKSGNYGELEGVKTMEQEKKMTLEKEANGVPEKNKEMVRNQNQVRLAVHNLLALENFTGKVGPQVSQIAKEFNNSVQATLNAEERIQNRNMFTRMFIGGDHEAAEEMLKEVNRNQERIQELKQLKENCEEDCSKEVKTMFQEQINTMEQEQNRLGTLANEEKSKKGLFGWIWK